MLATLAFSLLVIDKEGEESTLLQENNFFKHERRIFFVVGLSICIDVASFMRNVIIVILFIKNKTIVIFLLKELGWESELDSPHDQ